MRVPHFFAFILGITALATFSGCSRESSVKENVNLKNNHSRVFAFTEPIQDAQAFADSMANVPVSASDSIPDTLTVTINDTIYLMGILPYNVDKIYRFQWVLTKPDGKDTTIITQNATPQLWSYKKTGVYYPVFVAFDGNNATDTAGTATRRTYINVINTIPKLTVPKDTLWTKHNGTITFPITASDSFGTITKIMVDLDASGKKDSAVVWNYDQYEDNDSLYLSVKYDSTKVDSLGNQKIYVIVADDDGNETIDSVNLHFNRLPRLKILYPLDNTRHNIANRFYFYYEGVDDDNPQDLKYFIYAQVSKNGQPPQKAFTEDDLIGEDITSSIFEPINAEGKNVITLVKDPSKQLTGRIYWDMYVTDGYDIVRIDRISTGENSSRPWTFYIGDLTSTQGTFSGVAKYQGREKHDGIHIEFSDGNKTFDALTDEKGNYTIKVESGAYTVTAKSDINEYTQISIKDLFIDPGAIILNDPIELKDTVAPLLLVKSLETLKSRDTSLTIYARDIGSYLKSVSVKIDKVEQKPTCSSDDSAVMNCSMNLSNLLDGSHTITYLATDNAGNTKTLDQPIVIQATKISATVNGELNTRIGSGEELIFAAKVSDAYPKADSVLWSWNIGNGVVTKKTAVLDDGTTSFTLKAEEISSATQGKEYTMTAEYTSNGADVKSQVGFGLLGDDPQVIFIKPNQNDTVSINDPVHFKVNQYKGKESTTLNLKWSCGNNLSAGYTCPSTETETDLAFSTVGTHMVSVIITDDLDNEGTDTVTVVVVKDPPSISATTKNSTNEYKINSTAEVEITASDKFGTINKLEWGCSNGNVSFDTTHTFDSPSKSISDFAVNVRLPGTETSNYKCVFKATDDDGESGLDTLTFSVLRDPPTVRLATKSDVVKINSNQTFKAIATDKLGYIKEYAYACSNELSDLKNPDWDPMGSSSIQIRMPSTATDAYYCVVQVTDDDGNTARDTATYKVVIGRPSVTATVNYTKVTINDVVELNAAAQDSLGTLVKYEWGCGPASSENIGFTYSSTTTPKTNMTMPAIAQSGYQCIVRVTDDDGNNAKDTVKIDIIQAPPTVTVTNSSLTVRTDFNIALNATASDKNNVPTDPGSIVKQEWSCGASGQVENNWKTVSSLDTVWKAPEAQQPFYCITRVTDNDGNQARDTINITFTTEIPMIWTNSDLIYVNPGDGFSLNATVNDAWQGIDWFSWECIDMATGTSMEKTVTKYDYAANGKSFAIGKDSSYTEDGKDLYCIISAQETSGKDILKDTTTVKIIKQHPKGVITAADTVYLWSGDEAVTDEALYFYTKAWSGSNSVLGELGDKNAQDFWWKFSNVDGNFYQGNKDGSLDTNISEFNTAFIRKTREGSMTIYLDYRDSTTDNPSLAFYNRHRAPEVSRTVYFRKAWQNLSADTIIAPSSMNTAPAMTIVNEKPIVAYLESKTKVTVAGLDGSSWKSIASVTTTDSVTTIRLVNNGSDLFLGVIESSGKLSMYKSTGATSAFATMGSSITSTLGAQVIVKKSEQPHLVVLNSTDKKIYLYDYSDSKWTKNTTFDVFSSSDQFREVDALFNDDGQLVVVGVNTSYTAYYGFYTSEFNLIRYNGFDATEVSKINLATSGSTIYMGFLSRNVNTYGPYVFQGTYTSYEINWDKTGLVKKPLYEGYIAYNISLAIRNGILYAAIDDKGRPEYSQVHVFRYENDSWHFHGENQLPYFSVVFYENNGYYLRGSNPTLAISSAGKIYLSMLARENAGGANHNNGPLVMKYAADNWEIK